MTDETVYIEYNEENDTWVASDEAYIDTDLLSKVQFHYDTPNQITDNLNRRATDEQFEDAAKKNLNNNLVFYGAGRVEYPGKQECQVTYIMDCIIQYRDSISNAKNNYGSAYVTIGIPQNVIRRMISDGRVNHLSIITKQNERFQNGHCWMNCPLDKMGEDATSIVSVDEKTGEEANFSADLAAKLSEYKTSILAHIGFNMSINQTFKKELDRDGNVKPVNSKGPYKLSLKPVDILLIEETDIQGPELELVSAKKNTRSYKSGRFQARGKLGKWAKENAPTASVA